MAEQEGNATSPVARHDGQTAASGAIRPCKNQDPHGAHERIVGEYLPVGDMGLSAHCPGVEAASVVPRGMTVAALIEHLSTMPGDVEVVVNASDKGGSEVFALVKAAEHEPTCDDSMVCRLYADQEDDDAR